MKKLVLGAFMLLFAFTIMACDGATTAAPTTAAPTTAAPTTAAPTTAAPTTAAPIVVQGVTPTSIKVGNAASTTGAGAGVGVPFNAGIRAYFEYINGLGGIDGRTIQFVTYDDETNPTQGLAYTERLIEEDEIFALVGHFGTWTVGATLGLIQEVGIPMVYAATGINSLYFESSPGNPVLAVQPIYLTDGRIMAARAIKEAVYGANHDQALPANAKIGVIYTNDDVGLSIKAGIEAEAALLGKTGDMIYQAVTTSYATAVTILKASGVSAVILAMNQEPFSYALQQMHNLALNVPVFSSYVNADVTYVNHTLYNAARPIYVNAWLDLVDPEGVSGLHQDYWDYYLIISSGSYAEYALNNFAIAGYMAAYVFVEGLKRVEEAEVDLTWENYIAQMEAEELDMPMGGMIDWTEGKRWGISEMSMLQYTYALGDNPLTTDVVETDYLMESFVKVRPVQSISEIEEGGE
ncbi:MAG: ABC transporter substrate-binding protein [Candidatus Izemoplasmatales bacterium]|nr:ABC transporter substrate-binding protein [Candidatus Izemoplasmatales bacterium]